MQAQVLDQKTRHHHAQAVVHVAALLDLCHGRVHQRVAGAPRAPSREQGFGGFAVLKRDAVVGGLEGALHHVRVVGHDLVVEVAPNQFGQPSAGARIARQVQRVGQPQGLAHRERAKAQVHPQVARAFDGGKVARLVVVLDAVDKVGQELLRTAGAGGQVQLAAGAVLKPQVGQAGHTTVQLGGQRGQAVGERAGVVVDHLGRAHLFEPSVLEGREHTEGLTGLGQDLAPLKNHVVFVAVQHGAVVGQMAQDLGVALARGGFVVVVGEHGLHAQALGQATDAGHGRAMEHDQASARVSVLGPHLAQARIQLGHALAQEGHPAVDPGQLVQDVGVKDEDAPHLATGLEGVVQGGVVFPSQIAAEPHQAFVVGVHGAA